VTRRSLAALLAGGAVVVIVNAAILGTAASNRRGDRLAELTLTERELAVPAYREPESSILFLTLKFVSEPPQAVQRTAWRRRSELPPADDPWLDRAKLEALGFHLGSDTLAGEREVYVALELNGDSWARWLAAREERLRTRLPPAEADAVLALDRTMRSRLVPVDAGNDEISLRARFPDRTRYLIVRGIIRAVRGSADASDVAWSGQVADLAVGGLRVPRELAPALKEFLPRETQAEAFAREQREPQPSWPARTLPRYGAVVAFGSRNEPWLVSITGARAD
jgi:hypothetical protein